MLFLASATSAAHADPAYTLASPGTPLIGYVTSESVPIQVSAPSSALLAGAKLELNGTDVTSALQPDGSGSLSGLVGRLQQGANVFRLVAKTSKEPAATLTVMKAVHRALTCDLATISSLAGFPVQPEGTMGGTTITQVTLTPASGSLPEYCLVRGILRERSDGIAGIPGTPTYRTNQHYGTLFEVRLPTDWNGRYMFQGGGGTEGGQPNASGQPGGTAGVAVLQSGFVVAAQNGGHLNSELPGSYPPGPVTDLNHIQVLGQNMFFSDAQAVTDWAYNSIDITTQTAKFLIEAYYGRAPERSYFVGCSTSGRPDISLSETWGLERIIEISPIVNGVPQYLQSFSVADQNLFTNAILAACDPLDGLVDNVIDDRAACSFDPATFVFPSSGVYGSIAPGMPLQCTGEKTPTCLTPAQVNAVKKIAEGPRTSSGERIVSPDGTPLSGYPFDGGFMQPQGIPTRDIGTVSSAPGNIGLGSGQLPLFWFAQPDPTYNPLAVNYDSDMHLVTPASPAVNNSTDIGPFIQRGGKLIFYHGLSDSGPPWPYTYKYFHDVAAKNGGLAGANRFMKMYLVPNMGHCSGNMATDSFNMLTPMVNWIENGVAPEEIIATGNRFSAVPGPYAGLGSSTRSRPLCPYPKTLRYKGGDIAQASSYACQ